MSDEESTITVDLSNEDEEWVRYARRRKRSRSDTDVDEESLEAEVRANLEQAVYRYLETLDNNILDGKRIELCDQQLFDELASLVVQRAQNVEEIRKKIQERLRTDEDVSPFDRPRLTREMMAEYLVEEEVGKAEIRGLADLLLEKKKAVLETDKFDTDTSRTETSWALDSVVTRRQEKLSVENNTRLNSRR